MAASKMSIVKDFLTYWSTGLERMETVRKESPKKRLLVRYMMNI